MKINQSPPTALPVRRLRISVRLYLPTLGSNIFLRGLGLAAFCRGTIAVGRWLYVFRNRRMGIVMAKQQHRPGTDDIAHNIVAPKPKFGAPSLILIGSCVAVAIIGIFIGVIVIYGGSH
jgi:hypothetical protein